MCKGFKRNRECCKIHCRHSGRDWTEQCCAGNFTSDSNKENESLENEVFIAEGANGMLTFYIKDAKLWSAENTNLYRLTVSTESDSVSLVIGLREVIFDAKKECL